MSLAKILITAALATLAHAHGGDDHEVGNDHSPTLTSGVHSPPEPPAQTGCPTVTVTGELCATCPVPACLGLATATQRCGCPEAIPTVTLDFPCEDNCKGIFCTTSWDYVTEECEPTATGTATDDEPTAEPTVSATGPGTEDPSGPGPTDGPSGTGSEEEEPPAPTSSFVPAAAGKIAPMLAAPFAALLLL